MTPAGWRGRNKTRLLLPVIAIAVLAGCSGGGHPGLAVLPGEYAVVSTLLPHTMERVSVRVAINFRCPGCYKFESGIQALRNRYGSRVDIDPIAIAPEGTSGLPEQFYLLAKRAGKADLARSALYRAHFEQKLDIDQPATLARIAGEVGLPTSALAGLGRQDLVQEQQRVNAAARVYAMDTPGVLVERQLLVKPDPAAVAVIVDELLTRR